MYRTSNRTIPEVAKECNVSPNGLSQHLRFYHRSLLVKKEAEREQAKKRKKKGLMSGNGRTRGPLPETVEKYGEALKLYRDTDLDVKEIVRRTAVSLSGFRFYLREWHRDLILERRGGEADGDEDWIDLNQRKRYSKAVANKYAAAIAKLKAGGHTTSAVASEYGFHPEVFRDYLHKHEPELAGTLGMKRDRNGKLTASKAEEKYGEALRLYETTGESLKSIAARLGLVYNSIGGYVRRHYPELIRRHEALVEREKKTGL
jgi:transposase-like protein